MQKDIIIDSRNIIISLFLTDPVFLFEIYYISLVNLFFAEKSKNPTKRLYIKKDDHSYSGYIESTKKANTWYVGPLFFNMMFNL